jgi:hypothetical protein
MSYHLNPGSSKTCEISGKKINRRKKSFTKKKTDKNIRQSCTEPALP